MKKWFTLIHTYRHIGIRFLFGSEDMYHGIYLVRAVGVALASFEYKDSTPCDTEVTT